MKRWHKMNSNPVNMHGATERIQMHNFYPRDAMLARYMLWPCLCVSTCLSQVGVLSKQLDRSSWFVAQSLPSACPTLCYKVIRVSSINTSTGTRMSQTLNLADFTAFFRQCMSIIASVARPTTVASLLHWTSTVGYNTMRHMGAFHQQGRCGCLVMASQQSAAFDSGCLLGGSTRGCGWPRCITYVRIL